MSSKIVDLQIIRNSSTLAPRYAAARVSDRVSIILATQDINNDNLLWCEHNWLIAIILAKYKFEKRKKTVRTLRLIG